MTASSFDTLLSDDLAALGNDSRRDPLPLPEALRGAGVYRDERPGAEARRQALADERRRELAFMPLALAHVFAHRVGRAAAGGAAVLSCALLLLVLSDPVLVHIAASLLPELTMGSTIAGSGVVILGVYIVATWLAERMFERRMREVVPLHADLDADLEQLAVGPIDTAQQLVRRADGWAVGLSLAGVLAVGLVLGFVTFVVGAVYAYPRGWHSAYVMAGAPVAHNAELLLGTLATGLVAGGVVGRICDREHRRPTVGRWMSALAHWMTPIVGVLLGISTLYAAMHETIATHGRLQAVPLAPRIGLVGLGLVSLFLVASFTILWWRRREHARVSR